MVSLEDQDDEGECWSTKTPEERLRALEYVRRMAYGSAATERIQKVFEVVNLSDL